MFFIALWIIITNKAKAHCSVNNSKKFKTADAEEKGADVKEEPDDILLLRRIKSSRLRDSEKVIILICSRTIFRLGQLLSGLVSSRRILHVCSTVPFLLPKRHSLKFRKKGTLKAWVDFLGFLLEMLCSLNLEGGEKVRLDGEGRHPRD